MTGSWRWLLVVAALLIGAFAFACGDDGNGDGDGDADGDAGGDAFEDVPLPEGAKEGETLTFTGLEIDAFVPFDTGVDSETLGEITAKNYEVDGSPGDVLEFYEDNRGDWNEAFGFTADEGGILVWTKGDDQVLWILTSEGADSGTTELVVMFGQGD